MGLKRRSRFAMAACLLGANAPDIDVFAPLLFPVQGIQFHRGPVHAVFAWPVLAAGIVGILWLFDRLKRAEPGAIPFRAGPLFVVSFLAVLTHPFLDWLTTYAIALFAPLSWRWYSGNAIFIVDWVYWLLMGAGIAWSARRWKRHAPHPGRPAQIAGALMLVYIGFNLAESAYAEHAATSALRQRGVAPTLVIASPPPLAFWERTMLWRSDTRWGTGAFDPVHGLAIDPESEPLNLDDPRLARARASDPFVRAFLVWSRMPLVAEENGRAYLSDQRFYATTRSRVLPPSWRRRISGHSFLVPLDTASPAK